MRSVCFPILFCAVTLALFFVGCGDAGSSAQKNPKATNSAANSQKQTFHVRGVVKEIQSPTRARIAHEAIPGYMPAMTMPLDAKNTNELAGVKAGDQIGFDMVVTDKDGWIENVKRSGEAPIAVTGETNQGVSFSKSRIVEPLSPGDPVPDYQFVNEEGKTIHLSDFKGQALAVTFIFTRCPFPTFCPKMNSNFEKIATELSKPGGPTNWHLLSISFDPEYDTPARMTEYAKRYTRDAAKWSFATGEKSDIEAFTEQLGLVFLSRNGTIEHNLRTAIINPNGKLRQVVIGNEWDVDEFIVEMKKSAAGEQNGASK